MKLIYLAVVINAVLFGLAYQKFKRLSGPLPVPKLYDNTYWGPGEEADYKPDKSIKPFTVKRSVEEINDLIAQLNRTLKLTEPLEGISFQYGFNSRALEQLAEHWRDNYLPRWKEREQYLNTFPQFTTEIQGLRIHFIHAKPSAKDAKNKRVLPVLLLHGWPGSVREFYNFIPLLTNSSGISGYVFEVIAPSLAGFGWSQAAAKPGLNGAQMAIIMRNLMLRLGHEKFIIQGGDWGSIIGSYLSTIYPQNVLGFHSNMCVLQTPLAIMKSIVVSLYPTKFLPSIHFRAHHVPIMEKWEMLLVESGYFHIQATKPDTIGAVLQHNPLGLAAYILEKFQSVTGPGRNQFFNSLETVYTLDAVLDNVMIYYLSNTATTSARLYAESMTKASLSLQLDRVPSPVPMGCARFLHDLPPATNWALRDKFPNLIHSKYLNQGGHFAALELPVMLYIDFNEFVEKLLLI